VITDIRPIARADLSHLLERRPVKTLVTIRDTHHRVARAVAAGLTNAEVALATGYSLGRITTLKADPAFQQLIADYRGLVTAEYVRSVDNFMEIATANMLKAEVMISDKIDAAIEADEPLPMRDLIAITSDRADRFGYGKTQRNVNINVDFAAQLEAARKRSSGARLPRVIEGSPLPQSGLKDNRSPPALAPSGPPNFRRI
jgi:hypothetical protein